MEGPNAVERLYNLSERKLDSVSGGTAVGTNNQKYTPLRQCGGVRL